MDCPQCRSPMRRVALPEGALELCRACGGLWLDSEAIRTLFPAADGDGGLHADVLSEPELTSPLACHHCDGSPPLFEVGLREVADIHLDYCKSCQGLFVPPDEAVSITRHLLWLDSGDEPAPSPAAQPLLELVRAGVEHHERDADGRVSGDD